MPTALNRLLERPSALCLLRSIVHQDAFPNLNERLQNVCQYHSTSNHRRRQLPRSWSYRGQNPSQSARRGPRATTVEKTSLAQLRRLILKETEVTSLDARGTVQQADEVQGARRVRLSASQYAGGFEVNGRKDGDHNGAGNHPQALPEPTSNKFVAIQDLRDMFISSIPLRRLRAPPERKRRNVRAGLEETHVKIPLRRLRVPPRRKRQTVRAGLEETHVKTLPLRRLRVLPRRTRQTVRAGLEETHVTTLPLRRLRVLPRRTRQTIRAGLEETHVKILPLRRLRVPPRRKGQTVRAGLEETHVKTLDSHSESTAPHTAPNSPANAGSPATSLSTSHSPPAPPGSPSNFAPQQSPSSTGPDIFQENNEGGSSKTRESNTFSPALDGGKVRHVSTDIRTTDRPTCPSPPRDLWKSSRVIRKLWEEVQELGMDLPTSGPDARYIWTIFLAVDDLRPQVIEYAIALREKTGRMFPDLLSRFLISDFVRHPLRAFAFYERMMSDWTLAPGTMKKLASVIPMTAVSLGAFETIYKQSNQNDVYDVLMDRMLGAGLQTLAFQFDAVLRQRLDNPSVYFDVHLHPGFIDACRARERKFERADSDARLYVGAERSANTHTSTPAKSPSPSMDRFCARLFATKLLSFTSMVGFARMRGATSLGPLGLRSIAMGAQSSAEFLRTVDMFADEDLRPSESTFNTMLMRFARLKRDDLWNCLVDSDQHPDVFEDLSKQHQLLGWQLAVQEDKQAEVTLHVLTYLDPEPAVKAWNMVLQTWAVRVGAQVPKPLLRVIEEMLIQRIPFSTESLKMLKTAILRRRRIGRNSDKSQHKDYPDEQLLANIYRRVSENGQDVDWFLWKEILKRQGAAYKNPDFERLCYWLHWWHGPQSWRKYWRYAAASLRSPNHVLPEFSSAKTLGRIFDAYMIWAIIHWGFKAAFSWPRPRPFETLQGLRLLARLRDRGLPIKNHLVRRALSQRIYRLFKQRTFRTRWNRTARHRNPDSWELLVRESEKIWGEPIWHRRPGRSELLLQDTAHFSGVEPRIQGEKFIDRERRAVMISRRARDEMYEQSSRQVIS